MFTPAKIALAQTLEAFHRQTLGNTQGLARFLNRPFAQAYVWAPARMVDQAAVMLDAWQRNDSQQAPTRPPELPVCLVAVAKSLEPVGPEVGLHIAAEPVDVVFPEDPRERVFRVRLLSEGLRAQLAFFGSDVPTVQSLAAQFLLYLNPPPARRLLALYPFAGFTHAYPVVIDTPDTPAVAVDTNSPTISCLAVDLTLRITVPLFAAPGPGEPNDGQGVPGTDDPAGYPVVAAAQGGAP